jgi:hypothetical protein
MQDGVCVYGHRESILHLACRASKDYKLLRQFASILVATRIG